jgi:hypothetical protein
MRIVRFETLGNIKYGMVENDVVHGFQGSPFSNFRGPGSPFQHRNVALEHAGEISSARTGYPHAKTKRDLKRTKHRINFQGKAKESH